MAVAKLAAVFKAMYERLLPLTKDSVVAIGAFQKDSLEPYPFGTGTLFAVSNKRFIVTAAHVIDAIDSYSAQPCVFLPGDEGENGTKIDIVPVGGNGYRLEDPPDVGVISLSDQTIERMRHNRFLRLTDICIRPEYDGCGWVWGFPNEYVKDLDETSRALRSRAKISCRIWP